MQSRSVFILPALLALLPMLAMAPIKREATANRDALTELETKPFDPAAIAALADWSAPGTLDAQNIKGKVVLIAVVSSDPQSIMTVSKLARMMRDYQDKGLIVAAIHQDAGFEQINQKIIAGKVTIPVARDAGGVFATAMLADDFPDLYLIDRAGNLRFADFNKRALKDAIKLLTDETPETAASNAALQAQGLEPVLSEHAKEEQSKAKSKKRFSSASWPEKNTGNIYAMKDSQGSRPLMKFAEDQWVTDARPAEGKVLIIDFWDTGCGECRKAAKLYTKLLETYEGKLEVISISADKDREKLDKALVNGSRNFPQFHDPMKTLYNKIQAQGFPHTLILSTDGVIRWQGVPMNRKFKEKVEQIIAADPGIDD